MPRLQFIASSAHSSLLNLVLLPPRKSYIIISFPPPTHLIYINLNLLVSLRDLASGCHPSLAWICDIILFVFKFVQRNLRLISSTTLLPHSFLVPPPMPQSDRGVENTPECCWILIPAVTRSRTRTVAVSRGAGREQGESHHHLIGSKINPISEAAALEEWEEDMTMPRRIN